MLIKLEYETWMPATIERQVVNRFVMLEGATGFRWIKGEWMGANPRRIVWPSGREPQRMEPPPK